MRVIEGCNNTKKLKLIWETSHGQGTGCNNTKKLKLEGNMKKKRKTK